jgi:hypothetical protein
MIRKLASGDYRLYSRKKNPKTGRRRNLGTFKTRSAAEKHEREAQYCKHHQTNTSIDYSFSFWKAHRVDSGRIRCRTG